MSEPRETTREPEGSVPHLPTPPWVMWAAVWLIAVALWALLIGVVWLAWAALGWRAVVVLMAGLAWLLWRVLR